MTGQRVGYIRVSSYGQNHYRQLDQVQVDKTFCDTASGRDSNRTELVAMLAYVREGDTVVVHSLDRLGRNLDDLRRIVRDLTGRGVKVQFIKENLVFSGDDSPMSTLLLSVMGAFAEFERSIIRERQREGIELAKRRGAYRGRKRSLNDSQLVELQLRVAAGEKKTVIARELGISRETLYQYLKL